MISIIIPAYNEEEWIGSTIEGLKAVIKNQAYEIIVVDDGSKDKTAEIARNKGAKVLSLFPNGGKGQALNQGMRKASGEFFLLIDADLGESVRAIEPLLDSVLNEKADLSIAHFPKPRNKGGFGLVKGLAHYGLFLFTGKRYYSPISGQRAMRRQVFETIGGFRPGWGMEVAMTVDAYHKGFRIVEVPVNLTHRETGRDLVGFLHRGQQFCDIFLTLLKLFWQYRLQKGGITR